MTVIVAEYKGISFEVLCREGILDQLVLAFEEFLTAVVVDTVPLGTLE